MRINALLSGYSSVLARGGENLSPVVRGAEKSSSKSNVAADVFEQGQAWKNLAGTDRTDLARGNQDAAYAARAYGKQAELQGDFSSPAVSSGGNEKNASEAVGIAGEVKRSPAENGRQSVSRNGANSAKEETPQAVSGPKGIDGQALTQAERLAVAQLQHIDTSVKAHELAHLATAGSYARSGANFQYATGPDGKKYAVGGEVSIDSGKEATPEATISKMQTVRAAALAPADPSPQDQKVAARASLVITEASRELRAIRLEQAKGKTGGKVSAQAGLAGGPLPEAAENAPAPEGQQEKGSAPRQQPRSSGQKAAAAVVAGLMRPAPMVHITV